MHRARVQAIDPIITEKPKSDLGLGGSGVALPINALLSGVDARAREAIQDQGICRDNWPEGHSPARRAWLDLDQGYGVANVSGNSSAEAWPAPRKIFNSGGRPCGTCPQ